MALGGVLLQESRVDEAINSMEQALAFYRQAGYRKESMQAAALLARARVRKGDYPAALLDFDQQLTIAQKIGDPSLLVPALSDIGFTLNVQGRLTEALPKFDESLAIARSLGSKKDIALGLINRANVLWQLGHYDEARQLLAEAAPHAEQPTAARNMAVWFYLTAARMALSGNQWLEAKIKSERAIEIAGPHVKNLATEATFTLGLSQVLSGGARAGEAICNKAVAIAHETGNPSTVSDALLALAQAKGENGDIAGSLKTASESQEMLTRLGKPHYEWLALLIMARASRNAHDEPKAQDTASRAANILSGLEQKWGPEHFNSYLNRPDIRVYRKQLNQLLAQNPKPH